MLILFDGKEPICIRTSGPTRCEGAPLISSYVQRGLTPAARSAFELHLMDCTACRHSVELERLSGRATGEHKTSAGSFGARRVRRRR